METKIYYHVRHRNGVTAHWMDYRGAALALAQREGLIVFEVNSKTGRAVQIY